MTIEHAIERFRLCLECTDCYTCADHDQALGLAIYALEELLERRAADETKVIEAPAADAGEVKHGRWFDGRCTNCAWEAPDFVQYEGYELDDWEPTPHCPSCGIEMVGG